MSLGTWLGAWWDRLTADAPPPGALQPDPADAEYAALCLVAEDMFKDPANLTPAPDSRLEWLGWIVRGHLSAADVIFGPTAGQQRVYYGIHVERTDTGEMAIAIRGTQRVIEWANDAVFCPTPYPRNGPGANVERGFWGIYKTLSYQKLGSQVRNPAGAALAIVCAHAPRVVVTGHSLGGALGSFLPLDVTHRNLGVRLFASPRPGDASFAAIVARRLADCRSYRYEPDLVPRVPLALGYSPLSSAIVELPRLAAGIICESPFCWHHVLTYLYLLDPSLARAVCAGSDLAYAACLPQLRTKTGTENGFHGGTLVST